MSALGGRTFTNHLGRLAQDLAGTKEAEEAIKRTYITAQRTSQEMVSEAQEKSNAILDKAKGQSESMVGEARAELKRTREEAVAEHDALKRRIAQLRSAVGDMQSRLKVFAETASIDLEGLGASIDLETHSISEILENAAAESDEAPDDDAAEVAETDEPAEVVAEEDADEGAEAAAEDAREAAYLQQPRGQRPWERA